VATGALLGSASSASPTGLGRIAALNAAAAARSCAGRLAVGRRLQPGSAARIIRCLARVERSQLGLGYAQSERLSRMVAAALARFVTLPNQPPGAERTAATGMLRSICGDAHSSGGRYSYAFADTNSALTPLYLARLLARSLGAPDAVGRAARAMFGVALHQGLLFAKGARSGASVGLVALVCR
jgi:hypothetical protein